MRRCRDVAIGMTLVAMLVLAACVGEATANADSGDQAAKTGDLVTRAGTYEADGESYPADFGTLFVPENRDNPDSRLIELPVVRVRALPPA